MAANIATPITAVQGQGTVSFESVSPISGTTSSGMEVQLLPYVFNATAAPGWVFSNWIVEYEWREINGDTQQETTYTSETYSGYTGNPRELRNTITSDPLHWFTPEWIGSWLDRPSASPRNTYYCSYYKITAVFFFSGHTDLLVNSSDRTSPVTLVHDPTTGLLVADY